MNMKLLPESKTYTYMHIRIFELKTSGKICGLVLLINLSKFLVVRAWLCEYTQLLLVVEEHQLENLRGRSTASDLSNNILR
jgi:hypothetical protein